VADPEPLAGDNYFSIVTGGGRRPVVVTRVEIVAGLDIDDDEGDSVRVLLPDADHPVALIATDASPEELGALLGWLVFGGY
jgi:hypothetical protein